MAGGQCHRRLAYESNNLWTYLLDPFLAIYALFALANDALGALLGQRRPSGPMRKLSG